MSGLRSPALKEGAEHAPFLKAGGGSGTPTGPAGGVLTGEYPNPGLAALAVKEENLAEGSVTSNKIAAETIKGINIAKETITSLQLAEFAVKENNIGEGQVSGAKMANNSISSAKLQAESVTAPKLALNSVETEKIKKEAVTAEKLAPESVREQKIEPGAVSAPKVKIDTKPVPSGEENKVVVGTAGVARKIVAAITGNAVNTKFVIKHNLETQTAIVGFLTSTFEEPVTMLAKSVAISLSEVEVTFTVAPGAKVVFYVVIVG